MLMLVEHRHTYLNTAIAARLAQIQEVLRLKKSSSPRARRKLC